MLNVNDCVPSRFFAPARDELPRCSHTRQCPRLSDAAWIELGVSRVIEGSVSGRGFLQNITSQGNIAPSYTHFFETLKSTRRLRLCEELSERIASSDTHRIPDALAAFRELDDFAIRAGDGHWHSAASHDPRQVSSIREDGTKVLKKYPVGHLYTLDLRSHLMRHLTTADQTERRREHDMRGLKRGGANALRQGVPKGRKLLMVWDSAAIDFGFWQKLKQGHGIYFLCRDKDVEKIQCGERPWDRQAPVNEGIIADRQVSSSANSGYLVRIIEFEDPASGKNHRFITNEMTLAPGLLAHLYRMRWDIEKSFDEIKNRLNQTKAWATSANAKSMQGHFIALAHNLMLLLGERLRGSERIEDGPELKRRKARREKEQQSGQKRHFVHELSIWLVRATQRGVKFIRWLRAHFALRLRGRKPVPL